MADINGTVGMIGRQHQQSIEDAFAAQRAALEAFNQTDSANRKHEQSIEDMILAKGLTAPRITPQDLDDAIDQLVPPQYHVFPGSNTTVCLLTLKNGYTVTGESACVDPANFDEEIGREVAFKEARNKLWPLLGFLLRDKLAGKPKTPA